MALMIKITNEEEIKKEAIKLLKLLGYELHEISE